MIAPILSGLWHRLYAVLIGADDTAAAVVFPGQTNDLTISSRCGMALVDELRGVPPHPESLALGGIGEGLDELAPGHCFGAILADVARAQQVLDVLGPYAAYVKSSGLKVSHAQL